MDNEKFIPSGNIELIFDGTSDQTEVGIYISSEDAAKFAEMAKRLSSFLEDKLDQNMLNYCDYVQFIDLSKLLIQGNSKNNSYIVVCNCSK